MLLEQLKENYCIAAHALTEYRNSHGFIPSVKVIVHYRDEIEKSGIIADYGDAWICSCPMNVPILFDDGKLQLCDMSNMTIAVPM